MIPRYPIYVISKGRADCCLTAKSLIKDSVKFRLVIEPQERELYEAQFGGVACCEITILPFSNLGLGSIPARNWCWEHSISLGAERHWILDDNIYWFNRWFRNKRIQCHAGIALGVTEDFVDRYENVAIGGLNYQMFVFRKTSHTPPFYLNAHVYSCLCILNSIPYRWRGRYNEDTDLCLQVLSGGWCTVLLNAFSCNKITTMTMKGGNSTELYKGDGRLKMAESLRRQWPYVVSVRRRFGRPQHVIKNQWQNFTTPLRLKPGVDLSKTAPEMKLVAVKEPKSPVLNNWLKEQSP